MSDLSSISSLVREIRTASDNISAADTATKAALDEVRSSVNDLYRRLGRPGASAGGFDSDERADAVAMCQLRHTEQQPRVTGLATKEYVPSSAEIDEAIIARKAYRSYLRAGGDLSRLDPLYQKSLSAFSFAGSSGFLVPQQANFTIRCLADPSNLSGLINSLAISGPSLRIMIDNAALGLGYWACETSCFANDAAPDLLAGVGSVEIKPEPIRMVICSTRDLLEDSSVNVESWIQQRIDDGMRATINNALIVGDGNGKPTGLLNPKSGIPICETAASTPEGQFTWMDLVSLKYEIPVDWHNGASFIMNQRVFASLLNMNDASGRPIMQQMPQGAPVYTICGSPVVIASQMPDCVPGATPIAFGNWKKAYLAVWRKGVTIQTDPYSAGFCVLFKAEARVGGNVLCPNAARLLRIR